MSKNINYNKHQKSRYKKFTATTPEGKLVQADNEDELHKQLKNLSGNKIQSLGSTSVSVKPKFDPDTGERIN